MRVLRPVALFAVVASAAVGQTQTTLYPGLSGSALRAAIRADYTPDQTLGYNVARDALYQYEQDTDGELCGVYTRFCVVLTPGADPSTDAFNKGINAEHNWPQSYGASSEPARSNMHNLYPSRIEANADRGNHPFGEVPDADADRWYRGAQVLTAAPATGREAWSELDQQSPAPGFAGRFEPRHDHKGDAARSAFYFATIYASEVASAGGDAFFDAMKQDLVDWHVADPTSAEEHARSEWIATRQGKPNPFLLDSTLARRAFDLSPSDPGDPGDPGDPDGRIWVNEFHYDDAGSDDGEFIEVAGPAGAALDGWSLVLYNGSGGAVYATLPLSGALPDQQNGFGTASVAAPGLQNGSPDGVALVDPEGVVAAFLSYEGTFMAADGPAAGMTSADVGVMEEGGTAEGQSLQLVGTGASGADFAWTGPAAASPGQPNAGQTFEAPPPPVVDGVAWINEFHYDNRGADDYLEGVEIAGTPGLRLDGWSVTFYNPIGRPYLTLDLGGVIDDEGGLGAVWFTSPPLRNGGPSGMALVDAEGAVVQFLSYEGTLTPQFGPAAGLTSEDVGVEETNATPYLRTIQLVGIGSEYADFHWHGPRYESRGALNASQTYRAPNRPAPSASVGAAPEARLFPNPTAGPVTATVRLDAPAAVTAEVIDLLGRRVATVDAGARPAGEVSVTLDLAGVPAGLYVVRLTAGAHAVVRLLTVAR